ncbi:DUF262 domain-containing protein [Pelomonas sp. V22]|nr:DUF262 domain-containing protein [Pelomonas sp. V22]
MAKKTPSTALADILFPEALDQQEFADGILSIPPEQRKLHTETYDFTVATMVEKIKDGSVFVPSFQRRYVWTDPQASRLIESLIIQCPVPVIYLNQEPDERLSVIDGNQRLTSISRYLNNEFPLKGLTAYPELDGNRFHQLDSRMQRHIINRTLRCIVILKDTHPQVKFDVFERLNTGAVKLTPQELRHGLYYGDLINLATTVVKATGFSTALEIKLDKRMKAEELVLRFWALSEKFSEYKKPLAGFINSFADSNRSIDQAELDRLQASFEETLALVKEKFGEKAFKIFDAAGNIESSFNSALYDAEMIAMRQLSAEGKVTKKSEKAVCDALVNAFMSDETFRKSISIATSDESQLRVRVSALKKILAK